MFQIVMVSFCHMLCLFDHAMFSIAASSNSILATGSDNEKVATDMLRTGLDKRVTLGKKQRYNLLLT